MRRQLTLDRALLPRLRRRDHQTLQQPPVDPVEKIRVPLKLADLVAVRELHDRHLSVAVQHRRSLRLPLALIPRPRHLDRVLAEEVTCRRGVERALRHHQLRVGDLAGEPLHRTRQQQIGIVHAGGRVPPHDQPGPRQLRARIVVRDAELGRLHHHAAVAGQHRIRHTDREHVAVDVGGSDVEHVVAPHRTRRVIVVTGRTHLEPADAHPLGDSIHHQLGEVRPRLQLEVAVGGLVVDRALRQRRVAGQVVTQRRKPRLAGIQACGQQGQPLLRGRRNHADPFLFVI